MGLHKMDYPLALSSWGNEEIIAINRVITSNNFTMGEEVSNFEKNFAKHFNSRYAIMVNSGSSANLLAIAALFYKKENPLKRGDEVIVPAVSWSTTYYPLHQYGLKLKFVDIDIETLNIDLISLENALSSETKCIFIPNLLGNPNDFNKIKSLIGDKDIYLLEDNCESMGSTLDWKYCGTFGLMGTFSCFFSHHISTMEGGLITTDDEELYHILLSLRAHGWTRNLPKENKLTGIKDNNEFKESFNFILPGYNVRPTEMSGAIGIEQLKRLDSFLNVRRENAFYFNSLFKDLDQFIIQKEIGNSSWFGFSFIIKEDSKINRSELLDYLNKHNISTRPIVAGNFTENPVIKYFDYQIFGDLKNTKLLDQNGFFVGNHHIRIKESIDHLFLTITNFLKEKNLR